MRPLLYAAYFCLWKTELQQDIDLICEIEIISIFGESPSLVVLYLDN